MMQSPDVTKIEECNMKIKREALVSEYIEEALLLLLEKKEYKAITIAIEASGIVVGRPHEK